MALENFFNFSNSVEILILNDEKLPPQKPKNKFDF
jgi:hypothetical protein